MTGEAGDANEATEADFAQTDRENRSFVGSKRFVVAIALGILLVSVASFLFSLYNGLTLNALARENARLIRASSTPILSFGSGNISDEGVARISFEVSNSGTGPARVIWFQIRRNGTAYANLQSLAQASGAPLPRGNFLSRPLVQTLLRPGEDRAIISWDRPASDSDPQMAAWRAIERDRFDYEVEACYCSLLGDCWQSTLNGDDPQPVAECRAQGRPSFGDVPIMRRVAGQRSPG